MYILLPSNLIEKHRSLHGACPCNDFYYSRRSTFRQNYLKNGSSIIKNTPFGRYPDFNNVFIIKRKQAELSLNTEKRREMSKIESVYGNDDYKLLIDFDNGSRIIFICRKWSGHSRIYG